MGLLDYLLDVDKRSIQNRKRAENAVELEQQTAADQRQGVGLAAALRRAGKGPGAPVAQPDGSFKTPMDPQAAAAVSLMQNPGSRGLGNQLAVNVMDPAWQQQQQNAQDQGYATRQQVDMAAAEEARRNRLFPGEQTIQGQNITGNDLSARYARAQIAGQEALNSAAGKALQFNPGPPIPSGYIGSVIEQGTLANNAREGGGAARTLANIWQSAGTLDSMKNPEIKGTAIYAAMGTVPILQQILESGTLNEGELQTFTGLIGDLSNPESAWRRISTRDDGVIKLLISLADRSDRNLAAIKRGPVGIYINPETLTPMTPAWQKPAGFVPLDMPVTPEGAFENQGTGIDPSRGRNAVGGLLLDAAKGLPGALQKGFGRIGTG